MEEESAGSSSSTSRIINSFSIEKNYSNMINTGIVEFQIRNPYKNHSNEVIAFIRNVGFICVLNDKIDKMKKRFYFIGIKKYRGVYYMSDKENWGKIFSFEGEDDITEGGRKVPKMTCIPFYKGKDYFNLNIIYSEENGSLLGSLNVSPKVWYEEDSHVYYVRTIKQVILCIIFGCKHCIPDGVIKDLQQWNTTLQGYNNDKAYKKILLHNSFYDYVEKDNFSIKGVIAYEVENIKDNITNENIEKEEDQGNITQEDEMSESDKESTLSELKGEEVERNDNIIDNNVENVINEEEEEEDDDEEEFIYRESLPKISVDELSVDKFYENISDYMNSNDIIFNLREEDHVELMELKVHKRYRTTSTNLRLVGTVPNNIENNLYYPLIQFEFEDPLYINTNDENIERDDNVIGTEDEIENENATPVTLPPLQTRPFRAADRASVASQRRRREYNNNRRRNNQDVNNTNNQPPPRYDQITYRKTFCDLIIERFLEHEYETYAEFIQDLIRLPYTRSQSQKIKILLFNSHKELATLMNMESESQFLDNYMLKAAINNMFDNIFEKKREHQVPYIIGNEEYYANQYYYIVDFITPISYENIDGYLASVAEGWNKLMHSMNGNGMDLKTLLKNTKMQKDFFGEQMIEEEINNNNMCENKNENNKPVAEATPFKTNHGLRSGRVTEDNKFLDNKKSISSNLSVNSCMSRVGNYKNIYVNDPLKKDFFNHVSNKPFKGSKEISLNELQLQVMMGYFFQDDEETKEIEKENKPLEQEKEMINPVLPTPAVSSKEDNLVKFPVDEKIKMLPIQETLSVIIKAMTIGSSHDSLVDTYVGLLYGINYTGHVDTKRDDNYMTAVIKSNVSCATAHTIPVLSRRARQQTNLPTMGEINVTPHIFRVALDHSVSSIGLEINPNYQELYNNIEIGQNHTVFRPYFASNFEAVIAKGVFQKLILNTTKLHYQKHNDVARWLTLFLRAQQQSDVLDKNVLNPIVDVQVSGNGARAPKLPTPAYVDPNQPGNLPQLFPLHPDGATVAGVRVLPGGVCTVQEYIDYVVNGEEPPALIGGMEVGDINAGKYAVVFVWPHMQDKRLSMAEYTIAHCAHPMFHWTNRYSARYVDYKEDTNGIMRNTNPNGFVDPAAVESDFDYVLQSNNVRVDGATLGVIYVSMTNNTSDIRLPGNVNLTFAANNIFSVGHAAVDLRPVFQAYEQANVLNNSTWTNTQQWLRQESNNVADIVQARIICSNLSHLSYMLPQESQERRVNYVGAIPQNARWPSPHPNGGGRPWDDFFGDTVDLGGNQLPNVNCAYTAESFLHATSMLGQRVRSWVNERETNRNFEHSIGTTSPLQRLMLSLNIMRSKERANVEFLTSQGVYETVLNSKRIAESMSLCADMIYSMSSVSAGVLLAPILAGVRDTYSNLVVQRYYSGRGPQSDHILALYNTLTLNNNKSENFLQVIQFPGQYAVQPNLPYLSIISSELVLSKWNRQSKLFGFGEKDHLFLPKINDMSWEGNKDKVVRDGGNTLRYAENIRSDWKDNLTEISWSRLRLIRLTGIYIHGYETTYYRLRNYVTPENQSYSSNHLFLTECGLNMFREPSNIGNSWIMNPAGTTYLFFTEITNREMRIGTLNSITPWTQKERGFFLTPTSTQSTFKYDPHAATLNDIPVEHSVNSSYFG